MEVARFAELADGARISRRVALDLSGIDTSMPFAASSGRVALNVVLLGIEALGGEGRLTMAGSPVGDLIATIEGPRAAWPAGFAACLADQDAAWQAVQEPRTLQAPLTALIARRSGVRMSLLFPMGPGAGPAPLLLSLAGIC
jgi:hypothetical protein